MAAMDVAHGATLTQRHALPAQVVVLGHRAPGLLVVGVRVDSDRTAPILLTSLRSAS